MANLRDREEAIRHCVEEAIRIAAAEVSDGMRRAMVDAVMFFIAWLATISGAV